MDLSLNLKAIVTVSISTIMMKPLPCIVKKSPSSCIQVILRYIFSLQSESIDCIELFGTAILLKGPNQRQRLSDYLTEHNYEQKYFYFIVFS